MGTEAIAEKLSETVAVLGIIAGETNSAVDPVAITDKNLSIWESEALSHFRRSAWEDVVYTCAKVLDVPGQSETNYHVLFYMGFASMRLGDYGTAAEHFARAHRIDSRRAALRLSMHDLRELIRTMRLRKRSRGEASEKQRRDLHRAAASCATKTNFSPASA